MTNLMPLKPIDRSIFDGQINRNNLSADKIKTNQTGFMNEDVKGLREVADQFESIFLEALLSSARKSKLANGLLDSTADDNFEQMFDQEIAKNSSKTVDLGITEAIIRQMSKVGFSSE